MLNEARLCISMLKKQKRSNFQADQLVRSPLTLLAQTREKKRQLLETSYVCQEEECEQGSPAKPDEEGEQHQEAVPNPIMGQEGQNPSTLAEEAEEDEQALHAFCFLCAHNLDWW